MDPSISDLAWWWVRSNGTTHLPIDTPNGEVLDQSPISKKCRTQARSSVKSDLGDGLRAMQQIGGTRWIRALK